MDIHKVKPVHGLKEFFNEIFIIVVGVLIALGAEQIVQNLHWRQQVAEGKAALSQDFKDALAYAAERRSTQTCVDQQLDSIAATIDQASTARALPPVGKFSMPPGRIWRIQSWETLISSQTAAHFPRDLMLRYSKIAYYLNSIDGENDAEHAAWYAMRVLVGPGRRFSEIEEAEQRQALSKARYEAFILDIAAHEIPDQIKATGLLSAADIARAERPVALSDYPICHPAGAVPAGYGLK